MQIQDLASFGDLISSFSKTFGAAASTGQDLVNSSLASQSDMFSQFLCGEGNPLFNAGQGASEIDPTPKPDEFDKVQEIRDAKYPNGTCKLPFNY